MLDANHSLLVLIDMQERMMPAINRSDAVTTEAVRLVKACQELKVPILVTEQYPSGLGTTVEPIRTALGEWYRPVAKTFFSACEQYEFMGQFESIARQHVILCGVETHICVYQTARDFVNMGYSVQIVTDASGSRTQHNHDLAISKMTRHGVEVTSVEMLLFELMERSDIPQFKAVSALVKEQSPVI